MNNTYKGLFFALLAAGISGFSIFYNKLIIVKGIDPLIFNILKNGGVALILSMLLLLKIKNIKLQFDKKNIVKLAILGVVGGGIPFILYFEGLRSVPAINAALIHKSMFVWVAALAIPILGERLNIWQVIGYILVIFSNLFIGGFSGFAQNKGEILILLATLLWSVENILARSFLADTEAVVAAWGRMFFGTMLFILVAVVQNKMILFTKLNFMQVIPILTSVVLLSGYVLSWYNGLKWSYATSVTAILVLSTPITNILSAIFITRTLNDLPVLNILVTLVGVVIISYLTPKLSAKKGILPSTSSGLATKTKL